MTESPGFENRECFCALPGMDEFTKGICDNMRATMVAAGGASLVETQRCPFRAIEMLRPSPDDEPAQRSMKDKMRARLGIVSMYGDFQSE